MTNSKTKNNKETKTPITCSCIDDSRVIKLLICIIYVLSSVNMVNLVITGEQTGPILPTTGCVGAILKMV